MTKLRIGTRKSLLAVSQCSWVAREIERLNPDVKTELVGIETEGDRIIDIPLRQVEGQAFFVKELDDALLAGKVEITVHSCKDLSLDRPKGIATVAFPKRENPRDIALFNHAAIEKIRKGEPIRIGTSAPRRLENTPKFLMQALPRLGSQAPKLEFIEIRGNVNTRLKRLLTDTAEDRKLDGIILALAGLNRLAVDPKAWAEIEPLVEPLRLMVLPVTHCPSAPAQGALAVECRADDKPTVAALKKLNDAATAEQIRLERQILRETGGGCHQRFGATAIELDRVGSVLFIRGKSLDGTSLDEIRWLRPAAPKGAVKAWDGIKHREHTAGTVALDETPPFADVSGAPVFAAHARAVPTAWDAAPETKLDLRLWTSGTASWFKLAERGFWVEGCAEGLGFDSMLRGIEGPFLRLPRFSAWTVLTHETAVDSWNEFQPGQVIATYRREATADAGQTGNEATSDAVQALSSATHIYWGSLSQYQQLGTYAHPDAVHCCGPGKSADGIPGALVFPSHDEWRKWVNA